jgi:hypothetical protein
MPLEKNLILGAPTQDNVALVFCRMLAGKLKYAHGLGWMVYDGYFSRRGATSPNRAPVLTWHKVKPRPSR